MSTGSSWSIQQLAEFLAAVSSYRDEHSATAKAVERAAEAVEADVAALLRDGAVVAQIGFARGSVDRAGLEAVASRVSEEIVLPRVGTCRRSRSPSTASRTRPSCWRGRATTVSAARSRRCCGAWRGCSGSRCARCACSPTGAASGTERVERRPEGLSLEITETVLMHDDDLTTSRLLELKRLGIRLAMDDFGTGYSSLSCLRRFPLDTIKIDKSFIEGITTGSEEGALARAIVRLGQTLRLEVVAEGIEQADQCDQLRALRCPYGQGFFFAKPLPPELVAALLACTGSVRDQHLIRALV